jgi:hypothetical protein
VVHARHALIRDVFAPGLEPPGHGLDLRVLRGLDVGGQVLHLLALGAGLGEGGHIDGLLVVGDHLLGERDIGVVVLGSGVAIVLVAAGGEGQYRGRQQGGSEGLAHGGSPLCDQVSG